MKLLALEFSSAQRSVAVLDATHGSPLIASEIVQTGAGAMRTLSMVDAALREAKLEREQIECLAVGLGPGSYTGIRAGISLSQGWQLALNVKLLGVSSADAIAAQAQADGFAGNATVIIDAQRDEIYLAEYEISSNGWRIVTPLRLAALAEAQGLEKAGATLIGPEITRWFPAGKTAFPQATAVGRLALTRTDFIPGEKLEPIYLREAKFVKAPPSRALPT